MKVIKKFTAIKIDTKKVNDSINVKLTYGEIQGPYYSQEYPDQEFDTDGEAIAYAYKFDKYATWLILPIIKFDKFEKDEE
jgi:hypothetical protein